MVAIKPAQANAFLSKPDPKTRMILLYGPDAGLVSERSQQLAKLCADREKPAGEVLRLDDADLESDGDRLAVELLTVPMFGGSKIVRATAGRRMNAAIRALLDGGDIAGVLIVEAGNLRRDEGLRGLFEKSAMAVAIASYPDEGASLISLVKEVVTAAGKTITPDAQQELIARLGADRVLSRAEVEKLVLFAGDADKIEVAHVEAIVGDAADLAVDQVITAAAAGDMAGALIECDRLIAGGESGQSLMLAAERHFQRLHRLKASLDSGRQLSDLVRQMRPPLPQKAQQALERQARAWRTDKVAKALSAISELVKLARTTGADEAVLAERLLMNIAYLARPPGRPQNRN